MAWLIMLLVWVAVTVLVGYPYVEKIEKLRNGKERFFSYFALAVRTCGEGIRKDWYVGR